MRSRSRRCSWFLLLSLLLATAPGLLQAAAQSDPAAGGMAAFRDHARGQERLFGPARGTLVHDEAAISLEPAGVSVRNFYATASFTAPYDGADQLWDAGFAFRVGRDADWRIVVYSDGTWDLRLGAAAPIDSGRVDHVNAEEGETNEIELAVVDDTGYLAVNGEDVASFDLARRGVSGDVYIGTGFLEPSTQPGAETVYSSFEVWALEDDGPPAVDDDARSLLEDGRDLADATEPLAGPESGSLEETTDAATVRYLDTEVADFYARAEVTNPRDHADHPFDVGFFFRDSGDRRYRLAFASDGSWYLGLGLDPVLAARPFAGMKTGAGETNELEVAASGDALVFAVNGDVVGSATIADLPDPGDLALGVGFYPGDDAVDGAATAYADFTVWELGAQAAPTREASTPEPTSERAAPERTESAGTPAARDPAEVFADELDRTRSLEIVFGPERGDLQHDTTALTYAPTGLDLQNFIAHAEFTNPYPASEGDWDIGFIFRLAENEADLRLIVASTGDWLLATGSQQAVGQGRVDGLNVGRNERNSIDLVVDGDTGYFGVNDQFVSELDLSSVDGSGDIAVATGFFQGSSQSGASTPYRNFVVWSLEAAPATPESTRTARTPEPTARAGERTATPTAGGTYESPTYGYAIAYDESWTPSNESSRNGVDIVSFDNGVSQIDVQGFPTDQTPVECVDDEFNFYETGEGFSNAEVAVDTNNQEMRGEAPDRAYGVFTLTFTPQNGRPVDLTSFVECIEIESGVSMLKIVQLVTVRDYNDQIDARQGLLDGLTIPGKGAEGSPEARTVTPEGSETPAGATPGTTGAAIVVQISPAADPKVTGLATIDLSGNRATIRVLAVGADDGTVVLIQEGACDSLSGRPAFLLNPLEGGVSETEIAASVDELTSGGYAITLNAGVESLDQPIACGGIGASS